MKIAAGLLALPAAVWGLSTLVRLSRAKLRRVRIESGEAERDFNYLLSIRDWVRELDQPIDHDEKEYTHLKASLTAPEAVKLRLYVRQAAASDTRDWTSLDVLRGGDGRFVSDAARYLISLDAPGILLGEPGSGKSVTLRHIALRLTEAALERRDVLPKIPIYVQLGAYNDVREDGSPESVEEFIRRQLREVIPGGATIADELDDILAQRRAVVLLDSMDEMPATDYVPRTDALRAFLIAHGRTNQIVVACRRREYSASFRHTELVIEPFDARRIGAYLERSWDLYSGVLSPSERLERRASFMALASPDHDLHEFAANPFSLKLLSNYFFGNDGRLPGTRAELLDSHVQRRIERGFSRLDPDAIDPEKVTTCWCALSLAIIKNNLGTYFRIEEVAPKVDGLSVHELKAAVEFARECGIAREERDGSVRFEHHRVLEHLAAKHWELHPDAVPIDAPTLENPWFREMVVLRAGITPDPQGLVGQLADVAELSYVTDLEQDSGSHDFESVMARLDYLATLEATLSSAGERWTDLEPGLRQRVLHLPERTLGSAASLEIARAVRATRRIPARDRLWLLTMLVASSSNWVVDEVFRSVGSRRSDEFRPLVQSLIDERGVGGAIVSSFELRTVRSFDVLRAMLAMRGESLQRALGRAASTLFGAALFLGALGGLGWAASTQLSEHAGELSPSVLAMMGVLALAAAGTGGWKRGAEVVVAFSIAWFVDPLQDGLTLTVAVVVAVWNFLARDLDAAPWVRRPRRLWLIATSERWQRLLLFAAAVHVAFHTLHHLENPVGDWWRGLSTASLAVVHLGCGGLLELLYFRHLASRAKRAIDRARRAGASKDAANALAFELSQPWPPPIAASLLDAMAEMRTSPAHRVSLLKDLVETGRFFMHGDEIMRCVDTIDLKRRQMELSERGVPAG